MGSIRTGIELQDNFTNTVIGIINSVNLAVSAMENMSQAMNTGIDTASLEGARNQIDQATIAADQLSQAFQEMIMPKVQEPVTSWQSDNMTPIDGSEAERFTQEVFRTSQALEELNATQLQIEQTARDMDILPTAAVQDIAGLGTRIQKIQQAIQNMESNHVDIGTDVVNGELEKLRGQLNKAVQEQNNLNQALENLDVSEANAAYLRLSQTVSNTERYINDNANSQEEFNQTIQQGTSQANNLVDGIKGVVATYATLQTAKGVLNASDDLTQTTARLHLMNDGVQSTQELLETTYMSAQDARGSFTDMADVVARLGNNAKDAFSSSAEVVDFANLVQKQMTIAGTGTQEASNAILQLSQALGSGVLRGDELNSIFEQAPNLIQSIADYLNVPIGKIKEMASEGELSADVVKNAIFAASDEINEQFASMPMTWNQTWQSMQDTATMAFQPVLQEINAIANSEGFQNFTNTAINDLAVLAGVALEFLGYLGGAASFVSDNWGIIAPIIGMIATAWVAWNTALFVYNGIQAISNTLAAVSAARSALQAGATLAEAAATTTATGAQVGLNTALLACPITWIILLIIALIAVVIAVANHIADMGGTATTAFGVITGGVNVALQFFKNLGLGVANIALGIWEALKACAENFQIAFHNAICSVQSFWYNLLSDVLTVIEYICKALNKLPFIEFDYSGITKAADDYAGKAAEAENNKQDYTSISDAFNSGVSTFDAFSDGWVKNAYDDGAKWGDDIANKVKKNFSSKATELPNMDDYTANTHTAENSAALQTANNTSNTAKNTAKIADSVAITSEDLKYLRDMAEQESVNRYTTASITVNQTNHNTVNSDMDLDGITEHLRSTMEEQMAAAAEGVH